MNPRTRARTPSSIASNQSPKSKWSAATAASFVLSFVMAWSPFQRANAGIVWVRQPGDYANPIPTTSATGPQDHAVGLRRIGLGDRGFIAREIGLALAGVDRVEEGPEARALEPLDNGPRARERVKIGGPPDVDARRMALEQPEVPVGAADRRPRLRGVSEFSDPGPVGRDLEHQPLRGRC